MRSPSKNIRSGCFRLSYRFIHRAMNRTASRKSRYSLAILLLVGAHEQLSDHATVPTCEWMIADRIDNSSAIGSRKIPSLCAPRIARQFRSAKSVADHAPHLTSMVNSTVRLRSTFHSLNRSRSQSSGLPPIFSLACGNRAASGSASLVRCRSPAW